MILDWSQSKAFADDKINVIEKLKHVLETVENIMLEKKMLATSIFSFSDYVFNKLFLQGRLKSGLCGIEWYRVKYCQMHYTTITFIQLQPKYNMHIFDYC